jgi:hypothetical protein
MVATFRHQDVGQQARAGDTTRNRATRRRCLNDNVAAGVCLLLADGADDLEGRRDDFHLFGDIFVQRFQISAVGARYFLWFENVLLARQMHRQRRTRERLARWGRLYLWLDVSDTFVSNQFFQAQFQLVDLPVQFLDLRP